MFASFCFLDQCNYTNIENKSAVLVKHIAMLLKNKNMLDHSWLLISNSICAFVSEQYIVAVSALQYQASRSCAGLKVRFWVPVSSSIM